MERIIKFIKLLLLTPIWPIVLVEYRKHKDYLDADMRKYKSRYKIWEGGGMNLILNLLDIKSFRNVFYYRIGSVRHVLNFFLREQESLHFFDRGVIGKGLVVVHGDSTFINPISMGENCTINQCVTIGYSRGGRPVIGNNVTVRTGAIVIGGITIGNNVSIAAGSVVIKDVPDNCMVAGNPAVVKKVYNR